MDSKNSEEKDALVGGGGGGGGGGGRRDFDGEERRAESKVEDEDGDEDNDSEAKRQDAKNDGSSSSSKQEGISGELLLERVQEYFYGDEALGRCFENFVNERCDIVDLDSTEYKLEYTRAYQDYQTLFEQKLGGYIENDLGGSISDFYETLKAKSDEDEFCGEAIFAQILLSILDFDIFMVMMREGAQMAAKK